MVLALLRVRLAGSKLDDTNPAVRPAFQFSCRPKPAFCVVIEKEEQAKLARSFQGERYGYSRAICLVVGDQLSRVPVGLQKPDLAVLEISQQFFILLWTHVSRPHDFSAIDVRAVENPFIVRIVKFGVPHDDQLLPRQMFEFRGQNRAVGISSARERQRVTNAIAEMRCRIDDEQKNNYARQSHAKV